jgi:hypothetical protein
MKRGAALWAAACGLILLLAVWVTTSGFVPSLRGADSARPPRLTTPGASLRPTLSDPTPTANDTANRSLSTQGTVIADVLLVLLAICLALIVFHRIRLKRRTRTLRKRGEVDDLADDGRMMELADSLAQSAERGLAQLIEGEPRDAIVRCWVILEATVESAGLARDPSLTSEEFTRRVLGRFDVDMLGIRDLGELYREARFSRHTMGESHRERALVALSALRTDLSTLAPPAQGVGPATDGGGV